MRPAGDGPPRRREARKGKGMKDWKDMVADAAEFLGNWRRSDGGRGIEFAHAPEVAARVAARQVGDRMGICLSGMPGCGKTELLSAIAAFVAARGLGRIAVEFAPSLAARLAARKSYEAKQEACLARGFWNPVGGAFQRDLAIDDLGVEPFDVVSFGNHDDPICTALEIRHRAMSDGAVTYATTNLNEPELARRYGQRVWSRLTEMFAFVRMPDVDWRRRNRKPPEWGR